jgi:coenzyme F420-reducing hydrogenase beta subunit
MTFQTVLNIQQEQIVDMSKYTKHHVIEALRKETYKRNTELILNGGLPCDVFRGQDLYSWVRNNSY